MTGYRSDVIGSLLRPAYLKEAHQQRASGELSHVEFKKIEDRAVDEAIALQTDAGLDVLTDGEMRRYAFFGHLIDATEGYDKFGGFEPLKLVPEDRTVVLGLVTTKKPALEPKEELKRRIEEATAYVPLERLALSTQCGFASTEEGNLISPAGQAEKLRLVAETAEELWGRW